MKRRDFISITAAAGLSITSTNAQREKINDSDSKGKLKPKALVKGDTIGIIAPGTAVTSPDDYLKSTEVLEYLGLKYRFAMNVKKGNGYKTRTIRERVDDIHEMFSDNSIKGVFCLRGGYGSGQLLDSINFEIIKKNPKIFIGYSDVTALHLAINKITNLTTFHGPVLIGNYTDEVVTNLNKMLFTTEKAGFLENNKNKSGIRIDNPVRTIREGISDGLLTGGNLSLICSLMGTRYEIITRKKILFIEDVDEEPYKIDRMLTQLKTSGKLQQANGIIFGKCDSCNSNNSQVWDYSLGEVLNNILGELKIPSFYGLTFGHTDGQITIPYGLNAEINAGMCTLNITESACI